MIRRNFIAILLLLFFACEPAENETAHVLSVAGLNLRAGPSIHTVPMVTIPFARRITLLAKGEQKETIQGLSGFWYKARFENREGWVFGPHLSIRIRRPVRPDYRGLMYAGDPPDQLEDRASSLLDGGKDLEGDELYINWYLTPDKKQSHVFLQKSIKRKGQAFALVLDSRKFDYDDNSRTIDYSIGDWDCSKDNEPVVFAIFTVHATEIPRDPHPLYDLHGITVHNAYYLNKNKNGFRPVQNFTGIECSSMYMGATAKHQAIAEPTESTARTKEAKEEGSDESDESPDNEGREDREE